jgi:CRP-like cAMP-binding protein
MPNPLTMKLEQFTRFKHSECILLDELLRHPTKTYRRGQAIVSAGEKVENVHLVVKGLAARSKMLDDGSRQMMAFLIPGDLCDVEVFVLNAMDHDILAMTRTTCVLIPAHRMERLLSESSNVTRALWWSTMTDSAVLREWIVSHGQRDAHERIAHLFCELLIRYRLVGQALDNTIPFPLTQEELAEATGMTPIHVNRMLRQLRDEGLIEHDKVGVRVLDYNGLSKVARYEPEYLHLVRTERADPAVKQRVGDLVPPTGRDMTRDSWENAAHPFQPTG